MKTGVTIEDSIMLYLLALCFPMGLLGAVVDAVMYLDFVIVGFAYYGNWRSMLSQRVSTCA